MSSDNLYGITPHGGKLKELLVFAESISRGDRIALRHPEGMILAVMTVTDIWQPDRRDEAEAVFNTTGTRPTLFTSEGSLKG